MKAFLFSAIAIVVIAIGASTILTQQFQTDSATEFSTEGARLSSSEARTVSY
ncbi:MAG: hypothetical protein ACJASZ_002431 [Yoonia sp.]|jgi:hypothetical protein